MTLAENFFVIAFVVVLILGLVMIPIRTRIARRLLAEWAKDQKFELAEAQARFLRRGPFSGRASKSQTVFYLKIRDQEGNVRTDFAPGRGRRSPPGPSH